VIYPSFENFTWSNKKYYFGCQKDGKKTFWGPKSIDSKKKYTFGDQKGENKPWEPNMKLRPQKTTNKFSRKKGKNKHFKKMHAECKSKQVSISKKSALKKFSSNSKEENKIAFNFLNAIEKLNFLVVIQDKKFI
jgi:hypothetical protein